MQEVRGNIWDYCDKGNWIVITTNGNVKANGKAVMGKGIALEAVQRFPELPLFLGGLLKDFGNRVHRLDQWHIITFPTKYNWWEKSSLKLIETSAQELQTYTGFGSGLSSQTIYMVRPGVGNGGLDWKDVKPTLEKYLDDRYVVVSL